jgi:hypothetical protein
MAKFTHADAGQVAAENALRTFGREVFGATWAYMGHDAVLVELLVALHRICDDRCELLDDFYVKAQERFLITVDPEHSPPT